VRPDARVICVVKEGADHTLAQEAIDDHLVKAGQAGHSVVRLKVGAPCIFGRGGEVALRLAEAGVAFEVVPGVSSACAAAAYAGIPLTLRDLSSQAVLITGHERPTGRVGSQMEGAGRHRHLGGRDGTGEARGDLPIFC
jgi:uroporphyrinogen III methyltransferase/synthase